MENKKAMTLNKNQKFILAGAVIAYGLYKFAQWKNRNVYIRGTENNLRSVKVTYTDGQSITTNMASHITDKQIKEYFKKGAIFNIGTGPNDYLVAVKSVKILK
jgi:UDP-N-acetylmuramoylalanine-D-glutamate ligase